MRILLCPDSFKGCLTSKEVCYALRTGIEKASKNIEILQFPSSDGGEGFCDCMQNLYGGEYINRTVRAPLGNQVNASYLLDMASETAYIELASASGLGLVPEEQRNIMHCSTYGTGELMRDAVNMGAKRIVVGLGGSATNDCGIGILSALGMRFYDKNENELGPIPASLAEIAFVDKTNFMDLTGIKLIAACDVRNVLCGKYGAAEIFSRQKGAREYEVAWLDKASMKFAKTLDFDPNIEGSGAAGGAGAALISILGAEYVNGASLLIGSDAFKKALSSSDLIVTGEGNTDAQSVYGKLVGAVLSFAKERNKQAVIISGGLSDGYEVLYSMGASRMYSLTYNGFSREYCIENASALLAKAAEVLINEYKNNGSI